ncbi:MAG: hypothetical protein QXS91_01370 [Candidatus Anstonellales archaeon]
MKKHRAQVSFELLAIIFFIFALFIPILYFFYIRSSDITRQASNDYASAYLDAIYSNALSVYHAGNGSYVIAVINVPNGIKNIAIKNINSMPILLVIETEGSNMTKIMPANTTIDGKDRLILPGIREINISYDGNAILIKPK